MQGVMKKYFYNIRMAQDIGWEVPKHISQSYGLYHFNNYITFTKNEYRFTISCEYLVLWEHCIVHVSVDGIEVYKNGWIHNTPAAMKRDILVTVKEIENTNKEWKKNDLQKAYIKAEKDKKKKEKLRKIKQFEDEKEKLHDLYSSRNK